MSLPLSPRTSPPREPGLRARSSWCQLGPLPGLEPAGESASRPRAGGKVSPRQSRWAVELGKLLSLLSPPPPTPLQGWQGLKVVDEVLNMLGPDTRHQEKTPLAR